MMGKGKIIDLLTYDYHDHMSSVMCVNYITLDSYDNHISQFIDVRFMCATFLLC